jgi:hypothetical protein
MRRVALAANEMGEEMCCDAIQPGSRGMTSPCESGDGRLDFSAPSAARPAIGRQDLDMFVMDHEVELVGLRGLLDRISLHIVRVSGLLDYGSASMEEAAASRLHFGGQATSYLFSSSGWSIPYVHPGSGASHLHHLQIPKCEGRDSCHA